MESVIAVPTGNVSQFFRVEEKKNQNQVSNECTEFRTFWNQEYWTLNLRTCRYHLASRSDQFGKINYFTSAGTFDFTM